MLDFIVLIVAVAVCIFIAIKADRQLAKKQAERDAAKKAKDGQVPKKNIK